MFNLVSNFSGSHQIGTSLLFYITHREAHKAVRISPLRWSESHHSGGQSLTTFEGVDEGDVPSSFFSYHSVKNEVAQLSEVEF